jgi:hypothetical protein
MILYFELQLGTGFIIEHLRKRVNQKYQCVGVYPNYPDK